MTDENEHRFQDNKHRDPGAASLNGSAYDCADRLRWQSAYLARRFGALDPALLATLASLAFSTVEAAAR